MNTFRIIALSFFIVSTVRAQEAESPPPLIFKREPLPSLILKNKKEGRYFTGFPAPGWDPDLGPNFGAVLELYKNNTRADPFFNYTPYREKWQIVGLVSTRGYQQYFAFYDRPYVNDSPWRIRGFLQVIRNPVQGYFGTGSEAMEDLHFSGSDDSFSSYDDYKNALKQETNGSAFSRYDQYRSTRLDFKPSTEYDLLGGILRILGGFQISHIWIHDYTGDQISALDDQGESIEAIQSSTKLSEDCASGKSVGCSGGWDNFLKFGVTLDTRDFEPDPSSGIHSQLTAEISDKTLGSSFDYQRFTFSTAAYQGLLPSVTRLILAGRVLYSFQTGTAPVYTLPTIAFTERDWEGLGGFRTLRGFKANRFLGKAVALTNWELRWSFAEADLWSQHLRFGLAPFWEAGRAFNGISSTSFNDWAQAYGAGVRLSWNESTIICVDYGQTRESSAIYAELNYPF